MFEGVLEYMGSYTECAHMEEETLSEDDARQVDNSWQSDE